MSESLSILIVEDDPSIPLMIRRFMSQWTLLMSVTIIHVDTLADAMKYAPKASVILLDLTLKDANQEQSMQAIPEMSQHAPVIVMTGHEDGPANVSDFLIRCVREGASFAVFKTMLSAEGMKWLLLIIQAAITRRLNKLKSA